MCALNALFAIANGVFFYGKTGRKTEKRKCEKRGDFIRFCSFNKKRRILVDNFRFSLKKCCTFQGICGIMKGKNNDFPFL